jgi:hypothetical protein
LLREQKRASHHRKTNKKRKTSERPQSSNTNPTATAHLSPAPKNEVKNRSEIRWKLARSSDKRRVAQLPSDHSEN